MKTILFTGSSGYVATHFVQTFHQKYNYILLSRQGYDSHLTLEELLTKPELLDSIDVIVNLAGANIGAKRWTQKRKDELINSRISVTSKLVEIFNKRDKKPHLISASAIGIYDEHIINTEATCINYDTYANFSQEITKKWESCVGRYLGELTITRFGVVFGSDGGAFPQMLQPFRFGLGSTLGSGNQYMAWISLPDLIMALDYVISNNKSGVYNFVAPDESTNYELTKLVSRVWKVPSFFKTPKLIIKLLFGQMGEELFLSDIRVKPYRLIDEKFTFGYPKLEPTLRAIKALDF